MTRRLLWLLALCSPSVAHAGACCVGTTSTVPTQLGPCESGAVGVAVTGVHQVARWDGDGAVRRSSLSQQSLRSQIAGSFGLGRRAFVSARLPLMLARASTSGLSAWGGGAGDLSATVTYRVVEEQAGDNARPVVQLEGGLRAPTGRSWQGSKEPLGVDITGRPQAAMLLSASVQRSAGDVPWSIALSTTLEPTDAGLRPTIDVSAGVGRYLGTRWSLIGTAHHNRIWTPSDRGAVSVSRTGVGARLVHGQRLSWRAWVGVASDVPIAHFGREQGLEAQLDGGIVLVR